MRPALQEQRHFRVTAHEGCEAGGAHHIQATLGRPYPQDTIHLERRRQPLERVRPQVLVRKVSPHELEGGSTDGNRIRRSEPLNARGHVRGFTQSELFLAAPPAHLAHDYHAGVYADANCQLHPWVLCQARIERSQSLHNTKASAYGAGGVVFMRLGVAKVH